MIYVVRGVGRTIQRFPVVLWSLSGAHLGCILALTLPLNSQPQVSQLYFTPLSLKLRTIDLLIFVISFRLGVLQSLM